MVGIVFLVLLFGGERGRVGKCVCVCVCASVWQLGTRLFGVCWGRATQEKKREVRNGAHGIHTYIGGCTWKVRFSVSYLSRDGGIEINFSLWKFKKVSNLSGNA